MTDAAQGYEPTGFQNLGEAIDRDGNRNRIQAAREAGVEHVMLVSA